MINGIATNCINTSKIKERIKNMYLIILSDQEKFLNFSANKGISEISK